MPTTISGGRDRPRAAKQPFDDDGIEEADGTPEADAIGFDPERDMPGSVYAVPNLYWEIPGGPPTPALCAYCSVAGYRDVRQGYRRKVSPAAYHSDPADLPLVR